MGLDGVEIVMEVERDFGIKISDAEAEKVLLVSDLRDLVLRHLLAEPNQLPDRLKHLVFLHLQTIVSEQMAIKKSKIKPESRFVEDIGI
jgi:acyl carrier protein